MKTIEILRANKKAGNYIKEWFLEKLANNIKNFKRDESFKQLMSNTTVTDEQIDTIISEAPRNLLDLLDDKGVMITIVAKGESFSGNIYNARTEEQLDIDKHTTRKEFDVSALQKALPILEENLAAAEDQGVIEDEKKEDE
jgi:DNA-binding winged helix-turn-helix (wHTH) protein